MDFCAITPTAFLPLFATNRRSHLVLAHLIEQDSAYRSFYQQLSRDVDDIDFDDSQTIIMDNSAFELYKAGQPMYDSEKLLEVASYVKPTHIVLSDYPGQPAEKTQQAALELAPKIRDAGYGTFFCPQSRVGELQELIDSYLWAREVANEGLIDYIAFSILNIPNAYAVESGNNLQRFMSRWAFIQELSKIDPVFFTDCESKFHFLGLLDGPNEIDLILSLDHVRIDTWDSSAPIWYGLNDIAFDKSPTGAFNGKFEEHVDFNMLLSETTPQNILTAAQNLKFIDDKAKRYSMWE